MDPDDFLDLQRRRRRTTAIVLATLAVATAGFFFAREGHRRRAHDELLGQVEALLLRADPASLAEVSTRLAKVADPDAGVLSLGARSQLVRYRYVTGRRSELQQAQKLLAVATPEDAAAPPMLLARAYEAALSGRLVEAAGLADGLRTTVPANPTWWVWMALIDAEISARRGEPALIEDAAPLAQLAAGTLAWEEGRWPEAAAAWTAAGSAGQGAKEVATLASLPDEEARQGLGPLLEGGALAPVLLARAAVAFGRVEERLSGPLRAVELLTAASQADPGSPVIAAELSRLHGRMGQFTLARATAVAALQDHRGDEDILAAWAEATWALDDPEALRRQLTELGRADEPGWGVVTARGLAALLSGEAVSARFPPGGRGAHWRCQSALEAGDAASALLLCEEALRLEKDRVAGVGTLLVLGSRLRLIHAQALAGRREAAGALGEVVREKARSPWTSWLRGRAEVALGRPKEARAPLLDGCFRGQDFALGCLELGRVYQRMELDAAGKSTQREAWQRYLRITPKGAHLGEARAVLDQGN